MGVKGQGAHVHVYIGPGTQSEDIKQPEDGQTPSEGYVLISEEMKSDQSHPGGGPRKNLSLARQGRG